MQVQLIKRKPFFENKEILFLKTKNTHYEHNNSRITCEYMFNIGKYDYEPKHYILKVDENYLDFIEDYINFKKDLIVEDTTGSDWPLEYKKKNVLGYFTVKFLNKEQRAFVHARIKVPAGYVCFNEIFKLNE
jgi:hypothetical protein